MLCLTGCALAPAPHLAVLPPAAPPLHLRAGAPGALTVTRVAHSTVLLDFDGAVVLTDPWFSQKTGYHQGEPLGVTLAALPRLSAVVASHAHYDHFDLETFKGYPDKHVPFFVGREMVAAARAAGFTDVRGLAPWESGEAGGLTFTATPGAHGMEEVTWVITGAGRTVFFGGDSLKVPALDEVATRLPRLDLALVPINGLRAVGHQVVMSAEEAAALTATLRPDVVVPMHYAYRGSWFSDTFILSYDGTPERFVAAVKARAPQSRAVVLSPGEALRLWRE